MATYDDKDDTSQQRGGSSELEATAGSILAKIINRAFPLKATPPTLTEDAFTDNDIYRVASRLSSLTYAIDGIIDTLKENKRGTDIRGLNAQLEKIETSAVKLLTTETFVSTPPPKPPRKNHLSGLANYFKGEQNEPPSLPYSDKGLFRINKKARKRLSSLTNTAYQEAEASALIPHEYLRNPKALDALEKITRYYLRGLRDEEVTKVIKDAFERGQLTHPTETGLITTILQHTHFPTGKIEEELDASRKALNFVRLPADEITKRNPNASKNLICKLKDRELEYECKIFIETAMLSVRKFRDISRFNESLQINTKGKDGQDIPVVANRDLSHLDNYRGNGFLQVRPRINPASWHLQDLENRTPDSDLIALRLNFFMTHIAPAFGWIKKDWAPVRIKSGIITRNAQEREVYQLSDSLTTAYNELVHDHHGRTNIPLLLRYRADPITTSGVAATDVIKSLEKTGQKQAQNYDKGHMILNPLLRYQSNTKAYNEALANGTPIDPIYKSWITPIVKAGQVAFGTALAGMGVGAFMSNPIAGAVIGAAAVPSAWAVKKVLSTEPGKKFVGGCAGCLGLLAGAGGLIWLTVGGVSSLKNKDNPDKQNTKTPSISAPALTEEERTELREKAAAKINSSRNRADGTSERTEAQSQSPLPMQKTGPETEIYESTKPKAEEGSAPPAPPTQASDRNIRQDRDSAPAQSQNPLVQPKTQQEILRERAREKIQRARESNSGASLEGNNNRNSFASRLPEKRSGYTGVEKQGRTTPEAIAASQYTLSI